MVLIDDDDDRKGIIDARIYFDPSAFLDVFERVEIDDKETPSRLKYSYHLTVDGSHIRGWDNEPAHTNPQLRFHINNPGPEGGTTHEPDVRRTLKQVVEECWELVTRAREDGGS